MLVTVNYGNKVRETRKAKKVSQGKLAKLAGISQQDISDIEHNKNKNVNTDKILRINNVLNLDITDCLDTDKYSDEEIKIARRLLKELYSIS